MTLKIIDSEGRITKQVPKVHGKAINLEEIVKATYNNVQDWINNTQSAGYVDGGVISDAGSGKIDVTALKGFIKTSNSAIGVTKSFDLAAQNDLDILTTGKINYVYVDYNNGSPQILATVTRSDIELNRHFTLGRVYRDGTTLHIVQSGVQLANHEREAHERLVACRWIERASGIVLSDAGSRKIASTAGIFYMGHNEVEVDAQDTSATPTPDYFTYWSYISGAWVKTDHDQTQISDRQYNDVSEEGSEVLANLTSNRYGVHWVFMDFDNHLHVLYGQGDYKLTQAQDAILPAAIPDFLQYFCLLVARIIKKEQVDAFTEVASAYEVFFPTTLITDHGELGGLEDDDHSQYHNDARGDARYYTETELDAGQLDGRYFTETEHLDSSAGAGDAGKPIKLDAGGKVDATMVEDGDIDHGSIGGLDDDDHSQYHNNTRGDVRYLYKENTTEFVPDGDYEPATKKYVDDVALDDLADVIAPTPSDGDLLSYEHPTGWVPRELLDADIPAGIARDGEVVTAIYLHNIESTEVHGSGAERLLHTGDVDDTPVNGATTAPVSSNRMYDHEADTSGVHKILKDTDGDTKIQVEESADEDKIRMDVAGVESFLLDNVGIQTLAKQSACRAYRATSVQSIPTNISTKVNLNGESYDVQNEFDSATIRAGVADATEANKLHDADGGFEASDVGATVWNTTTNLYTTVTAFVDSGELTLAAHIMVNGESYKLYFSRFTATVAGKYDVSAYARMLSLADGNTMQLSICKNGAIYAASAVVAPGVVDCFVSFADIMDLVAADFVEMWIYHNSGVNKDLLYHPSQTAMAIGKHV